MLRLNLDSAPNLRRFYTANEVAIWIRKAVDLEYVVRAQVGNLNQPDYEILGNHRRDMITRFQKVRFKLSWWSIKSKIESLKRLSDRSRHEELGTDSLNDAVGYSVFRPVTHRDSHSRPAVARYQSRL